MLRGCVTPHLLPWRPGGKGRLEELCSPLVSEGSSWMRLQAKVSGARRNTGRSSELLLQTLRCLRRTRRGGSWGETSGKRDTHSLRIRPCLPGASQRAASHRTGTWRLGVTESGPTLRGGLLSALRGCRAEQSRHVLSLSRTFNSPDLSGFKLLYLSEKIVWFRPPPPG